jgi:hypothetical protein
VKRQLLVKRVAERARAVGLAWALVRQGRSHEWWRCGSTGVAIPRHREIPELTALAIFRELETELGKDWWRR